MRKKIPLKEDITMENKLSDFALTTIRKMQQNELTESAIYEKIAGFAKGFILTNHWSLVIGSTVVPQR